MFYTEEEVINWIHSFKNSKPNRNLTHLHEILPKMANPHLKFKTIHVAGTNGKGSTVAYLREVFMQSGYTVATFTSPFIQTFGERISINNKPISAENLIKHALIVKKALPGAQESFTSFDILTLISLSYFSSTHVDIAIYETGIGGRLDATNVIVPLATAITNVGHDHAEILGATQERRASEKLGIVKSNIPLFTTEQDPSLLELFGQKAAEVGADLIQVLKYSRLESCNEMGTVFDCCGQINLSITMKGAHQFKNAALAVAILEYLRVHSGFKDLDVYKITDTTWLGRFELMQETPPVIIDGAHNIEGIKALIKTVKDVYPLRKKKFVFSAIATKDAEEMLDLLQPIASNITLTTGTHPLSLKLAGSNPDYKAVIDEEIAKLTEDEVLIICGSLYFIADARAYLTSN